MSERRRDESSTASVHPTCVFFVLAAEPIRRRANPTVCGFGGQPRVQIKTGIIYLSYPSVNASNMFVISRGCGTRVSARRV